MQRKLAVKSPPAPKRAPEFWCEALADAVGLDRLLIGRVSLPSPHGLLMNLESRLPPGLFFKHENARGVASEVLVEPVLAMKPGPLLRTIVRNAQEATAEDLTREELTDLSMD